MQAGRHQIQEIQVVLQEILLVGQSPDLADIILVSIYALKHIIFIQESVVNHVRVHDVQLAVLQQNVVLFQIFAGGQLLSVAVDLIVLVLHVIVILLRLLKALVLIQELGRRRLDLMLYLEYVVGILRFYVAPQRDHPVTLDCVAAQGEGADLHLVHLEGLLVQLCLQLILIEVYFKSLVKLFFGLGCRLYRVAELVQI